MHQHDAKVIDILKINMYFVVQDLKVLVLSEVLDSTSILHTHTHTYPYTFSKACVASRIVLQYRQLVHHDQLLILIYDAKLSI